MKRTYGWVCSCGAIIDVTLEGTPEAVETRRRALTVGWMALHSGEGHDTTVTRTTAVSAWESNGGGESRPPSRMPRGDAWLGKEAS